MTTACLAYLEGVAFWAPTLPGWTVARAAFRGEGELTQPPAKRPAPELLAPAERRRAPDTVALALEVAAAAARQSGRDAAAMASIFTSAHGDLAINDYMCATLASQPTLISPTKFHNSVHNASAGYWTIGTACHAASTALSAYTHSFAAGLFEAACQCAADGSAVLLVAFDVASTGALDGVTRSEGLLAGACVLAPAPSERTIAALRWKLAPGGAKIELHSAAARSLAGNAMADALPFFEWLARSDASGTELHLPLTASLALRLERGEAPPAATMAAGEARPSARP